MKTTTCTPAQFEALAIAHVAQVLEMVASAPIDYAPIDTYMVDSAWEIPCTVRQVKLNKTVIKKVLAWLRAWRDIAG